MGLLVSRGSGAKSLSLLTRLYIIRCSIFFPLCVLVYLKSQRGNSCAHGIWYVLILAFTNLICYEESVLKSDIIQFYFIFMFSRRNAFFLKRGTWSNDMVLLKWNMMLLNEIWISWMNFKDYKWIIKISCWITQTDSLA